MAIDLVTPVIGLFPRLGRIGRNLYVINQCQSDLDTALTQIGDGYEETLRDVYGPTAITSDSILRAQPGSMGQLISLAQRTLVRMVTDDSPTIPASVSACVYELIRQMRLASETVEACTVSLAQTPLTPFVGNGVLVLTDKQGDGLTRELILAEAARVQCVADSYSGRATVGNESFVFRGSAPGTSTLNDFDYPKGSGANATVRAVSATAGTLLTNGGFVTWSGSPLAAASWTAQVGVWGTSIVQQATPFNGTYSVKLVAGTLSHIYQDVTAVVTPYTSYPVNLWLRAAAGTVSAGVMTVALVDSSLAVINDDQGTPNSFTVALTALTTSWAAFNGVFRLPHVPPATVRLSLRISTGLTGDDIYLDDVCLVAATAAYPSGPGFTVFGGNVPFAAGDGWDVTAANDAGGESYLTTWQFLFDRLFGTRPTGLLLPSSLTPTISDGFILDP